MVIAIHMKNNEINKAKIFLSLWTPTKYLAITEFSSNNMRKANKARISRNSNKSNNRKKINSSNSPKQPTTKQLTNDN